jgi:Fe-S oxidoreductase
VSKQDDFIRELETLTRKYGITIGGCGCCGSPFLDTLKEAEAVPEAGYAIDLVNDEPGDELRWVFPGDFYWDHHNKRPIK